MDKWNIWRTCKPIFIENVAKYTSTESKTSPNSKFICSTDILWINAGCGRQMFQVNTSKSKISWIKHVSSVFQDNWQVWISHMKILLFTTNWKVAQDITGSLKPIYRTLQIINEVWSPSESDSSEWNWVHQGPVATQLQVAWAGSPGPVSPGRSWWFRW